MASSSRFIRFALRGFRYFSSMYLAATMDSLPPSAVASDNTAAAAPVTAVWAMMTVALSPVFSTRVSW